MWLSLMAGRTGINSKFKVRKYFISLISRKPKRHLHDLNDTFNDHIFSNSFFHPSCFKEVLRLICLIIETWLPQSQTSHPNMTMSRETCLGLLWSPLKKQVTFRGAYVPAFVCWWASRLLPCPGYYKQCCDEHWGARVSFRSGFLGVYALNWDCWVIWQFYFQFFRNSPHCFP